MTPNIFCGLPGHQQQPASFAAWICREIVGQPYGFPHWDSKTTVSPAFWLFLDVQKLKKTDTTYAEHFLDAHKGAICDNAVVVVQKSGKNMKNPF